MKFVIIFFSFSCLFAQHQPSISNIEHEILSLKETNILLFCRGGSSKSSIIAQQFNYYDTNITHVGIGFQEKGRVYIYNVSDSKTSNNSALKIDDLQMFLASDYINFFSLWYSKTTKKKMRKLKKLLNDYKSKSVKFDNQFNLNDDDSLYCSEFCVRLLNSFDKKNHAYLPRCYQLKNYLFERILNRSTLIYYPVDFFENNKKWKCAFSYQFDAKH